MRFSWKLHKDFKLRSRWNLVKIGCFVGLIITCFYGLVTGVFVLVQYYLLFFILPTRICIPLIVVQGILWIGTIYAHIMDTPKNERSLVKLIGDFMGGLIK